MPSNIDGVPALSFMGIHPGEAFTYRFTLPKHQTGTCWYHSHSGFQEQTGLYGAIAPATIDAAGRIARWCLAQPVSLERRP